MNKDVEEHIKKLEGKSTMILEFLFQLLEDDYDNEIEEAEDGIRVLGHAFIRLARSAFQSQQNYEKYLDNFFEIAKRVRVRHHPPS